ncbi:MAG: hypothetical protein E7285_04865 [Lachnospiraceae bacterium]|nr:hypothetical protein [Lachnospiraceae bacterium]
MLVGIIWCFCGALTLYAMKKAEKGKRGMILLLFLFFAFFGICGVVGGLTKNKILLSTANILSVSVLCFLLFFKLVFDKKACTTKVVGVYQGCQEYKSVRGYRSYAPIFQYYFDGREYQGQANENYSMKKITSRFTPGRQYTILINQNNPCQYVTGNSQLGNKILLFTVGLFMLAGYVIMLIQYS